MKLDLLAVALLTAACAAADTSAPISVDGRGLPDVNGILRDSSKAHYGFVNCVVFGPGWQYSAQDYAVKEQHKEAIEDAVYGRGLLFTGKLGVGSNTLAIREEFYDVSKGEEAKVHVRWTLANTKAGAPMRLERAYLRFPLPLDEFAGGRAGTAALPEAYGGEWIGVGAKEHFKIVSKDGTKQLAFSVLQGNPVVQDARKDKQERFEFRLDFPQAKEAAASTVEFEVAGSFADSLKRTAGKVKLDLPPPPAKLVAGKDWVEFPYTNEIKPGSILDFSAVVPREAPAGKYGFARPTAEGHLAFEQSARPVRFVGGNLCFDANFLSKEQCRQVVQDFVRRGWNTVRFHHIDVTITKDQWNHLWDRKTYPEISLEQLDKLDYLLAEFKRAGIYATFDLYAMGGLGSCEGFDQPLNSNTIKAVVPIHPPAEDQWFRRAMEIFDHQNPYTGMKWKDDPAILFVTLMNEDSIASVWWGAADHYVAKYNEWAKGKGYPAYPKEGIGKHREFAEFLYEVKAQANQRMARRLRAAGVKQLVTGGNWWDTMAQAYEREALDLVDNHGYGDHPQPSYQKLPFHVNQTSSLKLGNPTYGEPMMKAPSRILGKPFVITEYNFCPPNRYRAEAGLAMGAYAALQDWDALYRFAWSHSREALAGVHAVSGFDLARDPVGQLAERQVVLLFGRGDVAPARETYGYGVTKAESMAKGLGDMWANGLFPHAFTHLGYLSKIGSYTLDHAGRPAVDCTRTWSAANREAIPKTDPGAMVSDTREIELSAREGDLRINTPKTAAVCSVDRHGLVAGPLAVSDVTTFCNVSASSMDAAKLVDSRRVLILHLTDVLNTDLTFTDSRETDTQSWGKLPYLAKAGSAKIALKNSNRALKVYALASDGSRLREVPAQYVDGAYVFTAAVASGVGANAPTMMYELGK